VSWRSRRNSWPSWTIQPLRYGLGTNVTLLPSVSAAASGEITTGAGGSVIGSSISTTSSGGGAAQRTRALPSRPSDSCTHTGCASLAWRGAPTAAYGIATWLQVTTQARLGSAAMIAPVPMARPRASPSLSGASTTTVAARMRSTVELTGSATRGGIDVYAPPKPPVPHQCSPPSASAAAPATIASAWLTISGVRRKLRCLRSRTSATTPTTSASSPSSVVRRARCRSSSSARSGVSRADSSPRS
jgi:hypothetical protein